MSGLSCQAQKCINYPLTGMAEMIQNDKNNETNFFVTKIPSLLDIKCSPLFLKQSIPKSSSNHSIRVKVWNLVAFL